MVRTQIATAFYNHILFLCRRYVLRIISILNQLQCRRNYTYFPLLYSQERAICFFLDPIRICLHIFKSFFSAFPPHDPDVFTHIRNNFSLFSSYKKIICIHDLQKESDSKIDYRLQLQIICIHELLQESKSKMLLFILFYFLFFLMYSSVSHHQKYM